MGYQVRFAPTNQNVFVMAASDNKLYQVCETSSLFRRSLSRFTIVQWDTRSGEVVLEYNYHLGMCLFVRLASSHSGAGPCNTVTFFDEGRKFISTSDDKKILVWEFDTPVPIKYIQDANLHSYVAALFLHRMRIMERV